MVLRTVSGRGCVNLGIGLGMTLCLGYCGLALAAQLWLSHLSTTSHSVVALCAWSRGGRAGLWWNRNVAPSRAFVNAPRYNAMCLAVPWSSNLPERGRPSIDVSP